HELRGLERREALGALQTLAAAANLLPFAREPRIDDFRLLVITERTMHGRGNDMGRRTSNDLRRARADTSLIASLPRHVPYTRNLRQISSTLARTFAIAASLPFSSRISAIQFATCFISASRNLRVVLAGVPMRKPLVTNGGRGSFGTAFLLTVMCARPSAASASLPVMSLPIKSSRNR